MKHYNCVFRLMLVLATTLLASGCIQNHPGGGGGGSGGSGGGVVPPGCVPGALFESDDGCNSCLCPESGLREEASCTDRACPEQCVPGTTFEAEDGCNTCLCPASGIRDEAACTERACVSPCDGLICGDLCNPGDGRIGHSREGDSDSAGFAPQPEYACNVQGECVPQYQIESCEKADPCGDAACGDPCDPGLANGAGSEGFPADPARVQFYCDVNSDCVPSESETLACADRCAGLECGQPCRAPHALPGDSDADRAAGAELCNGEGACVFVFEEEELVCGGSGQCADSACGDPCFLDASTDSDDADEREMEGSGEPPAEQIIAPDGLCNNEGVCQPASLPVELMCDEDRCQPGTEFDAGDECNTCWCPDSGLRSEAECTLAVCNEPDPSCAGLACGDPCRDDAVDGDASLPVEGEGAVAPPQMICDANLRCVSEYQHEGCGM